MRRGSGALENVSGGMLFCDQTQKRFLHYIFRRDEEFRSEWTTLIRSEFSCCSQLNAVTRPSLKQKGAQRKILRRFFVFLIIYCTSKSSTVKTKVEPGGMAPPGAAWSP